jgi:hypothetical protein
MRPEEFCYWLQGFLEMSDPKTMDEKQVDLMKRHLALVFEHAIDPSYVEGLPTEEAKAKAEHLQNVHDGKTESAAFQKPRPQIHYLPSDKPVFRC